ncbi:MAG: hypothetical protein JSS22_03670 [Proteobacteria bacterium]|nr:hypothetical protein [Pseudomonadota bacterium]
MWDTIVDGSKGVSLSIDAAVRLILALVIRSEAQSRTIESVVGVDQIQLSHYPINLDSVTERARLHWPGLSKQAWISDLLRWILETHRTVALRKLAQGGDDTRRLRAEDDGLRVGGDVIDVTRTVPRLKQAFRFLQDLGFSEINQPDKLPVLTRDALAFINSHAR